MDAFWLPIAGFEGLYEVSDGGDVRSLGRIVVQRRGNHWLSGRTLKPGDHNAGYKKVDLYDANQKRYTFLIHRLVLEAFVGKRPEKMDGCHNNGDKTDNRLVNLRWDTRRNNNLDAVRDRRNANSKKDVCPRCGSEYSFRPDGHGRYCKPCKWEYQSKYQKERKA